MAMLFLLRFLCTACGCDSESTYHIWYPNRALERGERCPCHCHKPDGGSVTYKLKEQIGRR